MERDIRQVLELQVLGASNYMTELDTGRASNLETVESGPVWGTMEIESPDQRRQREDCLKWAGSGKTQRHS